jgi:ribose 5-phosphate isomerase B
MLPKIIVIGADHAGFALKETLSDHLRSRGVEVLDVGTHSAASVDYPDFAKALCREVLERQTLGVLICGSGIGMSMTANRNPGVRAAVCAMTYQAKLSRQHNNANVLCLGERITAPGLAKDILDAFLDAEYEGGRHQRRIDKMDVC